MQCEGGWKGLRRYMGLHIRVFFVYVFRSTRPTANANKSGVSLICLRFAQQRIRWQFLMDDRRLCVRDDDYDFLRFFQKFAYTM